LGYTIIKKQHKKQHKKQALGKIVLVQYQVMAEGFAPSLWDFVGLKLKLSLYSMRIVG
jgi:hypothetical protein